MSCISTTQIVESHVPHGNFQRTVEDLPLNDVVHLHEGLVSSFFMREVDISINVRWEPCSDFLLVCLYVTRQQALILVCCPRTKAK